MPSENNKILITGTSGFIGFHLAKSFLEEGAEVVGIDNFNGYYSINLKESRNEILEDFKGFQGIRMNLCDYESLLELFSRESFEKVCHLAAQPGVRYSLSHPFAYQKSNLESFLNVLEACRHSKVKRLVFASSSSVYGNNKQLPFSEEDSVDHPVSLYAATKKANELMAHAYHQLYGFQTIGLRFFTVYGPWGRPDMASWMFTDAILNDRPIKVFNQGNMRRDFTYIDDIIQGVRAALLKEDLDPFEIFNLGNHQSENLMDFINLIGRELGKSPEMELLPMQAGDVETTYADITKAREKLGFEPKTPIEKGIPEFITWFKNYNNL
ncbi:MAG TPA: NAD-dependent epimerase/dehydratase family protein [Verrucomicrobiales bacterium]|nr:NAD-dependent epimerase/dehydratase family protein [Verrucomicrobiales bacterium]HIL70349.1 NAD-dependent epimerase/dehydratase family protein [Verrucomicrobiota bacterium]